MKRSMKMIPTGEEREPRTGEFFKGSRGGITQARFDITHIKLPIMEMRVIDIPDGMVECRGFIIDDNDPYSFTGCFWKKDCPVCEGKGYHIAEDSNE
jgi:hypothetical protein